MSDTDFTEDTENDSQLVHDLRAQIKALGTANKTLTSENDTYKVSTRTTSVTDILNTKKVNPKIARFIPTDIAADDESITKWLEDNGDVFGVSTDSTGDDESSGSGVSAETERAFNRAQMAEHAGGVTAPVGVDAALNRLKSLEGKSFDEISRLLK